MEKNEHTHRVEKKWYLNFVSSILNCVSYTRSVWFVCRAHDHWPRDQQQQKKNGNKIQIFSLKVITTHLTNKTCRSQNFLISSRRLPPPSLLTIWLRVWSFSRNSVSLIFFLSHSHFIGIICNVNVEFLRVDNFILIIINNKFGTMLESVSFSSKCCWKYYSKHCTSDCWCYNENVDCYIIYHFFFLCFVPFWCCCSKNGQNKNSNAKNYGAHTRYTESANFFFNVRHSRKEFRKREHKRLKMLNKMLVKQKLFLSQMK